MKTTRIAFLLICFVAVFIASANSAWQAGANPEPVTSGTYLEGQILVLVGDTLNKSQATNLAFELGGHTLIKGPRKVATGSLLVLEVPEGQELKVVQALRRESRVLAADLNYLRSIPPTFKAVGGTTSPSGLLTTNPNDPIYREGQWNVSRLRLPEAWDHSRGSGVIIGHLDTGVWWDLNTRQTHEDLVGKVLWSQGWDFVNDDDLPWDDESHGTQTAGIAAAATNNGLGIAGAGWNARILPVKVLRGDGEGSDGDIAPGITHAVDHGAKVLAMSFGGPTPSDIIEAAVNYAWNHGAFMVASVGYNGDGAPNYPAAYPVVLAVTSTGYYNEHDGRSTIGDWVRDAVSAPGVEVWTTVAWQPLYIKVKGNSFAGSLVAGAATLLVERGRPNWWIMDSFRQTARPLGDRRVFGYGLLDVEAAIHWDPGAPQPSRTPEPTETPAPPPPTSTPTPTPLPIITIIPTATPTATPVPQLVVPDHVAFLLERGSLEEVSKTVTVLGIRLDGMTWQVIPISEPWLEVEPSSGIIPQEVTITVNPANLGSGGLSVDEYTTTITFHCDQAFNSPVTVNVRVVVVEEIKRIYLPIIANSQK